VAKGSVWKLVLLLAFVYCIAYFIDVLILVLDNCFKLLCIFFFSFCDIFIQFVEI
jgi:hypothetical protein